MPYCKNPVGGYDDTEIRRSMKELNKRIKEIEEVYTEAEGTEITVETVEGYARDIEILGNTIQDANNLEIIKSVGDKVKGQNVYKIDILVTNGLKKTDANYQEEVITILSPVQLEKVGDIADRIICKDGVWGIEKNIKTVVLDDSLKYNFASQYDLENTIYCFTNAGVIPLPLGTTITRQMTSFKSIITYSAAPTSDIEGVTVGTQGNLRLRLSKDTTIEHFCTKGYVVKYQLAESQFIPLPNSQQVKLRTFASKTNISFLTEIEGTIKVNVANTMVSNVGFQVKQIDDLNNELNRIKRLEDNTIFNIEMEENFVTINGTSSGYLKNIKIEGKTVRLDINGEVTEDVSKGKSLKSVGDGVDEVSVESVNSDELQSDKKILLYYNNETETWEKPILRQWDSIEKHNDGKYYYHKRSEEVVLNGSESWWNHHTTSDVYDGFYIDDIKSITKKPKDNNTICDVFSDKFQTSYYNNADCECVSISYIGTLNIMLKKDKLSTQDVEGFKQWLQANPVTVVYQLEQEEVYECTNIDLITYANETNLIINCGVVTPKITLESQNNITDVVTIMQEKTSFLRNRLTEMSKDFLSGDYYSLAYSLYPEDFLADDEDNENIEE